MWQHHIKGSVVGAALPTYHSAFNQVILLVSPVDAHVALSLEILQLYHFVYLFIV